MGFSTNYEDVNDDFGIIPEGDYEVVIRNIEERTTMSGATGLNLSLIIRNDVDQKFKDRYLFHVETERADTGRYAGSGLQLQADHEACKIGKAPKRQGV